MKPKRRKAEDPEEIAREVVDALDTVLRIAMQSEVDPVGTALDHVTAMRLALMSGGLNRLKDYLKRLQVFAG